MAKQKERVASRIELLPVEELLPYIRNPRQHSQDQVALIAASIKEFGFINPIIVTRDKEIIAGHGRLLAAKKLGLKKVPVIYADHLTPEQVKAYRIVDNRLVELGAWDNELLAIEIDELQKADFDTSILGMEDILDIQEELDTDPEEGQEEDVDVPAYEIESEPFTQPGDIWYLRKHRLICGDSTDPATYEALLQGEKVDSIVTDPPYGVDYGEKTEYLAQHIGRKKRKDLEHDDLKGEDFQIWAEKWLRIIRDHLAEKNTAYIFIASTSLCDLRRAMENAGYYVSAYLIWIKDSAVIARSDYNNQHEFLLHGTTTEKTGYIVYGWHGTHNFYGDPNAKTVLFHPRPKKNTYHPTQKPVPLYKHLIYDGTPIAGTVLDPFAGGGTVLIAAQEVGRTAYAIELDPVFVDSAVLRFYRLYGKHDIELHRKDGTILRLEDIEAEFTKRFEI